MQDTSTPVFRQTDLGNSERLVERHGDDIYYCHPWGKWLVWDGKRWRVDDGGKVVRFAKATVRAMYHEAGSGERIDKGLSEHACKSESATRLRAMLELAKSDVPVLPEDLDYNPYHLNCQNGTVELKTGRLRDHDRLDMITKLAPVKYDPDATAPTFETFLKKILPDAATREFLQCALGYSICGVTGEQVLVILHGTGANGKSTLINAVLDALGDYAAAAAPDLLIAKRGGHPTEVADLFGKRFVACMELEENRHLAESRVKQLTGGDRIKARRMREDFWEFEPTHTVFLGTNHRPIIRGTDHAIWRRIRLVPFEVVIPEEEQDSDLPRRLRQELPGILAWLVRGCLEWRRVGLGAPETVTAATDTYRDEMDVLGAFLDDRCVVIPHAQAPASQLYSAYKEWCDENGENCETQKAFGLRLREHGFDDFHFTSGAYKARKGWRGLGLRGEKPDPTDHRGAVNHAQTSSTTEKPIDKPDLPQGERGVDHSRPTFSINERKRPHVGVLPEQGQPSSTATPLFTENGLDRCDSQADRCHPSSTVAALEAFFSKNPERRKEAPDWLGVALWSENLVDKKPTAEDVRRALEMLEEEHLPERQQRPPGG